MHTNINAYIITRQITILRSLVKKLGPCNTRKRSKSTFLHIMLFLQRHLCAEAGKTSTMCNKRLPEQCTIVHIIVQNNPNNHFVSLLMQHIRHSVVITAVHAYKLTQKAAEYDDYF